MRTSFRLLRLCAVAFLGSGCFEFDYGITGPIWGPGGGTPSYPPGSFLGFRSTDRAVQLGDTLELPILDGAGAAWSVNDTSVATVSGDDLSGRVVGRSLGTAVVTVRANIGSITRQIDVVQALCQRQTPSGTLSLDDDTTVTLVADDCAIGYDIWLPWPMLNGEPVFPSTRGKVLQVDVADSTLLRVDAESPTLRPLLAIPDSAGRSGSAQSDSRHQVFVARLVPPGRHRIWLGTDEHRPSGDIRVQVADVPRCRTLGASALRSLPLGPIVTDTLDAASCHSDAGEVQQPWEVVIPTSGWYLASIWTLSPPPAYAFLYQHDVGFGGTSTWWEAGTYRLDVKSRTDARYQLRVVACASAVSCPP